VIPPPRGSIREARPGHSRSTIRSGCTRRS
jgi:hypothetical protein